MATTESILTSYPTYEVIIGIEVHVQLNTKSKIFCTCANKITKEPNSNICQICTGYPGVLPVLNKEVIHSALLAALATRSIIARQCAFDRKHYFYPDLPKNYQITQQFEPICTNGKVTIRLEDGSLKDINLFRIHIEEDAGKNIHSPTSNESFVDLNRTGTPLLEIVSKPDISSAFEARAYLKTLRAIVQYLGICSGNMEEGAFRADTNISVRKKGATAFGTKCELKNINSFKYISDAIEYEIERQILLLEDGGTVKQETRLWDTQARKTIVMRTKEEAADYRYFQDPDLPILEISEEWIDQVKQTLPELPQEKFVRFTTKHGLTPYEADIIIEDIELASYFDDALKHTTSKQLVNWILRDLLGYLKEEKINLAECKVTPEKLAALINLVEAGTINNNVAKEIFITIAQTGKEPAAIVKEQGLEQIGSVEELEAIAQEVIAENKKQADEYKATGNERMFGFFVGKAMQKTRGKGNPQILQDLLRKYLK
jgi:aspartyl-tRNA(Asn)/glutamyl-tRNA(Gln) amidotransferase subunit B